jgi:tetratricopeptide (TPR) repeat protein
MKPSLRAVTAAVLAVATLAAGVAPLLARAAEDLASSAAKAQAAFYARDAAALAQLAAATAPWAKSANPREQYAHAYVQFRALQVAMLQRREKDSEKAGAACVDTLDAALKREPKSAEALALQSSCYGYLAGLGGMGAIRNGSRSGKSVEAALALEPKNPRVILADAFGIYHRPKFVGGDKAKGCAKFREAAAAFDAAGVATAANGIGWGAPETHYWVGRCASDAGDAAAAKQAYERALALAPQFVAAKKALGR